MAFNPATFEFNLPTKIVFGPGKIEEAGRLAAKLGQYALVVTGSSTERASRLLNCLREQGVQTVIFPSGGEPSTELVVQAVRLARAEGCDLVVGFGGGSAIDAAKAAAALLTNPGELVDYLEVIGRGKALAQPAAATIAIPTTAGTGAEVTQNAVLSAPEGKVKVSLRSPLMAPRLALVDPELTLSMPADITARTGLDALTQLIEPFVSRKSNPMTDVFCREGIRWVARSLRNAYQNGEDIQARLYMSLASLYSGIALANAKLGAVHGFAGPIGGMFSGPHGAICARLLPFVMETNLAALQERAAANPALKRYQEVAQMLTGDDQASLRAGVEWVYALCEDLKTPGLSEYGMSVKDIPALVEKSAAASSMQGNPIELTYAEMAGILEGAL